MENGNETTKKEKEGQQVKVGKKKKKRKNGKKRNPPHIFWGTGIRKHRSPGVLSGTG